MGLYAIQAHKIIVDALCQRDKDMSRIWMFRRINDWRKGFDRAGKDLDQPIDRVYVNDVMMR